MKRRFGNLALRTHAKDLAIILGHRVKEDLLLVELERFVNHYRIGLEDARRSVMVLHGIPPGLAGPESRRFTWQSQLGAF